MAQTSRTYVGVDSISPAAVAHLDEVRMYRQAHSPATQISEKQKNSCCQNQTPDPLHGLHALKLGGPDVLKLSQWFHRQVRAITH